ncbi:MAG: rhodanese-like domain-containing protein [Flavobacteriales bacterium]|nr:rhodanese-like domain-containing protein [Flavobacteriales bacterium]
MRIGTAALFAVMASLCSAQSDGLTAWAVIEVTPEEVLAMLRGTVFLADVNEDFTYADAHLPGAKLLVYDAIKADQLPADRAQPIVFYCWSPECPAARMAAESAISLGYTKVHCMPAGITGWQDAGLRTEP